MTDDVLFTTEPNQRGGGTRNEIHNPLMQSGGGLTTFINSEELRTATDQALVENQQLKEQLNQVIECMGQWKHRIAEMDTIRNMNDQLSKEVKKCHSMSKTKVETLLNKIKELRQQNEALKKQITILQRSQSPDSSPDRSPQSHVLNSLKGHMQAVEEILRQELSSGRQDRDKDILQKLMGHIRKAEQILATPDAEISPASRTGERQDAESPSGRKSPPDRGVAMSPLSPKGQHEYDKSMQNVLGQLEDLGRKVNERTTALNKEQQRSEGLQIKLDKAQSELTALQGAQKSSVAAAMEQQKKADDDVHQHEIKTLMERLDELTLLAAERHQKHAFDEEPRYHSASNELKQQVTSLVAELEHKEKCLNEAKAYQQQMQQQITINDGLQRKVGMYHEELAKARREAQSYIDTIHVELKRKETLYQSERQKALHEKLQHDKCKEDLGAAKTSLSQLTKDRNKYQEKEDRYLAEILSAEEAIEAKELEKQRFEQLSNKFKKELQIWKTQTEVCQKDFQEERKAREQMHTEKMNFQARIDEMMRERQKMEEELEFAHRQQLRGPQYRPGYGGYDRAGGVDMYGTQRQVYDVPAEDQAGTLDPMGTFHQPYHGNQDLRQPQQATTGQQFWCPKCQQTFPDYDTLEIHLEDCID